MEMFLSIIGAGATVWGIIVGIIKLIKRYMHQKEVNRREFGIDGLWTAHYNENGTHKTEEMRIEINGQSATATISLPKSSGNKQQYIFNGKYVNRKLLGSFDDDAKNTPNESGTLALAYANDGLLSGDFSLFDEKGRHSSYPYALEAKSRPDRSDYSFCKKCHKQQTCCCNDKDVDAPVVTPNGMDAIACIKNVSNKSRIATPHKELWQIHKKGIACIFHSDKGCTIHNMRPNDCRLFPFDVIKDNDNFRVILYKEDACPFSPTSTEIINECKPQVERLIKLIAPYIDAWTDEKFMRHLKNQKYTTLGDVNVTDFTNPSVTWYE